MQRSVDIGAANGLNKRGNHVIVLVAVAVVAHHRLIDVVRDRLWGNFPAIINCLGRGFKIGQRAPRIATGEEHQLIQGFIGNPNLALAQATVAFERALGDAP